MSSLEKTIAIEIGKTGFLIVLAAIVIIALYYWKKRKQTIREPEPNIGEGQQAFDQPALTGVPIRDVDAPSMVKFFQDLAKEKPIRFHEQELRSITSNYSTRLGSGGFGVVYKGQCTSGVQLAVKVLKRSSERRAEEQFMAEIGTIGRTNHINLVRLYGFCYDHSISALVFEYMENGSLDNYLFRDTEAIEWKKLHQIAVGTAKSITYLHDECKQRIVHYDIKPSNVLLDADFFPKVADFGLAKLCNRDGNHVNLIEYRGTPGYSAPELMLKNFPITYKCDVYSYGMLLFEIVGRRKNAIRGPNESLDWFPKNVWDHYEKGELAKMTMSCGIEEKDREKAERMSMIALWCVQDSPEARPPMSAVVRMLEAGVDIAPPPRPFHYLFSVGMNVLKPFSSTDNNSSNDSRREEGSHSYWYKDSAPLTTKYEIQIVSPSS